MTRALMLGLLLGLSAPALAQEYVPPAPAAETSPEAARQRFETGEALEELRYRNLWIAYGAFWLLVFAFVWRTWQRSRGTEAELADLKARLAEMEQKLEPDAGGRAHG